MNIHPDDTLIAVLVAYLEEKGWYFDGVQAKAFEWIPKKERLFEAKAWTVPQWGEYWMKPYSEDPTHENYGAPKTRRWETLMDAVSSQLRREEQPDKFACFFDGFDKEN